MSIIFQNEYPQAYLDQQPVQSKRLNMVVEIEGIDKKFSIVPTYTRVRYGDPGVNYGDPGLVYGALRLDPDVIVALSLNSSLTISQKLEPEQGRGAVSTMSLSFVDFDEYFSTLISPGFDLDDPLGNKLVKVWLGYADNSFPDDYFVVFRGYISGTRSQSGLVSLQLSDSNLKRRAPVFPIAKTKTTALISDSATSIPVIATSGFLVSVQGPSGSYDQNFETYIQIDDEIMQYTQTGIPDSTHFTVTRGALGTTAVSHEADADVEGRYIVKGNVIDIALKTMISGWQGPYVTDQPVASIRNGFDYGIAPNLLRLPDGVNAGEVYNPQQGDYLYITGSTAGNDGTYIIENVVFSDGQSNNIIFVTPPFPAQEYPATTVKMALRSQYDVWPTGCGTKMSPSEIDMSTWTDTRDTFYNTDYTKMRFFVKEAQAGKTFIEKEVLLPSSLYSVTRFGRMSVKITLPPIAGQKIITLSKDNVIDPAGIVMERALNTRRFFNDVEYSYDLGYTNDVYANNKILFDSDSLNVNGLITKMPIESKGLRSDLNADEFTQKKGLNILNRYKKAAFEIQNVKTTWGSGSLIEAGDVVIVRDEGGLQITNLSTGLRDLGVQLFEVINRSVDIKTGVVSLTLLSNIGYQITDRFATISPTSQVAPTGSTTTTIRIEDSYGVEFPDNEQEKWRPIIGSPLSIHTKDFSQNYERTLVGFSGADKYLMLLDSPLPVVPDDSWVVDCADYPNTVNYYDNQTEKLLYAYISPTIDVTGGTSSTVFTVDPLRASEIIAGTSIDVHSEDFSVGSPETTVSSIVSSTVTAAADLGFTPSAGQLAETIGYIDKGGPFRIL